MERYFNFIAREASIYQQWERSGAFQFDTTSDAAFFPICMPPGPMQRQIKLTQYLNYVVMDLLGRYHRMQGKRVLLLPGKNMAGIEMQRLFEDLVLAQGENLAAMGQAEAQEQYFAFGIQSSQAIRTQEKAIGLSANWEQEIFTLDPKIKQIIKSTFTALHKAGLITYQSLPYSQNGKSKQLFAYLQIDHPKHSLKQRALQLIESGDINIYPAQLKTSLIKCLSHHPHWCISSPATQGQKLPLWQHAISEQLSIQPPEPKESHWKAIANTIHPDFYTAHWPFFALRNKEQEAIKIRNFLPNQTMIIGMDKGQYVACQMLLLAAFHFDRSPWKNIYFTGKILAPKPKIHFRSKIQSSSPIELIDQYGTDALRLGLILSCRPGRNIQLKVERIRSCSNFVNKIWNAARWAKRQLEQYPQSASSDNLLIQQATSHWILQEMHQLTQSISKQLDQYQMASVARHLQYFSRHTFCNWYLEFCKINFQQPKPKVEENRLVLRLALSQLLCLLHPFIPFVTEEIFQQIPCLASHQKLLILQQWNQQVPTNSSTSLEISSILPIIKSIRSIRAQLKIAPKTLIHIHIDHPWSEEGQRLIEQMTQTQMINKAKLFQKDYLLLPCRQNCIYLAISPEAHYNKWLSQKSQLLEKTLQKIEQQLGNAHFLQYSTMERFDQLKKAYWQKRSHLLLLQKEYDRIR
ncbi:MAG: class I tRNA ligase family protein [Bacteroidota bacterium]